MLDMIIKGGTVVTSSGVGEWGHWDIRGPDSGGCPARPSTGRRGQGN